MTIWCLKVLRGCHDSGVTNMTRESPLQGIGGVAPYPLIHRPCKLSHTFTYSFSLIPELVILTVMVGKLRVGADMGSVGSRESEGGEQSEHVVRRVGSVVALVSAS